MLKAISFISILTFSHFNSITERNINDHSFSDEKTEWKQLIKNDYSISYPDDWSLDTTGKMGTSFYMLSPLQSETDTFRENISLVKEDLKGQKVDLPTYIEASEQGLKTLITNYKVIESKAFKNEFSEYHQLIYTGNQGAYKIQFMQRFFIANGMAYVVTLTTEEGQFSTFQLAGEKIMDSFRINTKTK
jgi:hypothetical protein